jgi:hypothetical protein
MRTLQFPPVLTLAGLLITSAVSAAPPPINEINPQIPREDIEKALSARERPFFVGVLGGFAWATVSHPQVHTGDFMTATMGLHAGYAMSPRWALSFELTAIEKVFARASRHDLFSVDPNLQPAGANTGDDLKVTALFATVGPRLELTPFGRDGPYVSGSGGVAFVQGLDPRAGFGGTARLGFRLRAAEVVTFSIEAGFQGQAYADAAAVYPYGALLLRPYF